MSELDLLGFKAYVFDFDGTIADTISTHTQARLRAFDRVAQEIGDDRLSEIPPSIHDEAHRHGSNPPAIIGWALQAAGITIAIDDPLAMRIAKAKTQVYHELCANGLNPTAGAPDFVRGLSRIANTAEPPRYVGITTTAYRDSEVLPFLIRHKLRSLIPDDHIVAKEDVPHERAKPDPLAYQMTIERAGLQDCPDRMLVFEDTPNGVRAAKAAGATVVAVTTTHTKADLMGVERHYRPDFIEPGLDTMLEELLVRGI